MNTPEEISHSLAEVVAAAIKAAGYSQRNVSETAGIPLVTLNRKLTGRTPFNAVELAAIASVIGVGLSELALRAERAVAHAA